MPSSGDPAVAHATGAPAPAAPHVLLVGDIGMRLEVDFVAVGIACTFAPTASHAVAWMRASRFTSVVVPPMLPDMAGPAFALGLSQHFPEVTVLLYGAEVDGDDLLALVQQGRVVPFPAHADGLALADYVVRRAAAYGGPTAPASDLPPLATQPVHALGHGGGASTPLSQIAAPPPSPSALASLSVPMGVLQAAAVAGPRPVSLQMDAQSPAAMAGLAALGHETTALRTDLAGAKRQVVELQSALDDAKGEVAVAAQELAAERAARGVEAEALRAEIEREKKARADLNRELFDARNRLKTRERERDEAGAERDQLRRDYDAAKKAQEELRAQVATSDDARRSVQDLLDARMAAAAELKKHVEDARAETERARQEGEQLKVDLAEVQKAAAGAEQIKSRAQGELAAAKKQLEQATKQAAGSGERASALDDEVLQLKADVDRLKGERQAVDAVVLDHRARFEEADAERKKLRGDLADQTDARVEAEKNAQTLEATASRMATDLKTQTDQREKAQHELDDASSRIAELERSSERDQGKLEALCDERDALRTEARTAQQTSAERGAKLEAATADIARVASELEAAKAGHKSALEEIELRRRMATDEQKAWDDETRRMVAERDEARRVAADAQKTLAAVSSSLQTETLEKQVLGDAVESAEQDATAAKAELAALQKKLEATTAELALKETEKRKIAGELVALRVKGEKAAHDHTATVKETEAKLAAARAEELAAAKAEIDRLQAELHQALEDALPEVEIVVGAPAPPVRAGMQSQEQSPDSSEILRLETRLDAVTRERDRAILALTEASRKLMELEDERAMPVARRR